MQHSAHTQEMQQLHSHPPPSTPPSIRSSLNVKGTVSQQVKRLNGQKGLHKMLYLPFAAMLFTVILFLNFRSFPLNINKFTEGLLL
jgi:hypothetical protein